MFMSLTSRIAALGVVMVCAILVLVAAMADASQKSRESFRWVTHSSQVIHTMDESLEMVREAESGQRGYLLTRNPGFNQSFERLTKDARSRFAAVEDLTQDNPAQNGRLVRIGELLEERIMLMERPLRLATQNRFDDARDVLIEGHGQDTMSALDMAVQDFLNEERTLQKKRVDAAEVRLKWARTLALVGGPIIALLSFLVSVMIIQGIRLPVRVLTSAMNNLGQGDMDKRIEEKMGSREFNALANGYNNMAQRLADAADVQSQSEAELKKVHAELLQRSMALRSRGDVIELLAAMSHRMQATRTDEELADIIAIFVPRVLPDLPGALFAYDDDRTELLPRSVWGKDRADVCGFASDQCWALRRGQSHYVSGSGKDIPCDHVSPTAVYHCEPLLASGEVIGVLHLDGLLDDEARFRIGVLTENISSAMVNRRLQRDLKEQSIRDPLTGLFNRRYMEEALTIEISRSARSGQPLCVVMCDVDHFKRFNDEFGHDAGDMVLRTVAEVLEDKFRDGDIVCRYGGEEFTIIAPGTAQHDLMRRAEMVREAVASVALVLGNQQLGTATMSFGVAQWTPVMERDGSNLLAAADVALYQAKRDGRNRIKGYEAFL